MSWDPEDYIALSLTLIILIFLLLWALVKILTKGEIIPDSLELWTALIGSIVTGVLMYINRNKNKNKNE